ncbi:MAG: DUF1684 domain-containing protein [Ignavibacteria bacterium]|nr:DUF1684 domain-containing protein [Ignavibacteria bacterium]
MIKQFWQFFHFILILILISGCKKQTDADFKYINELNEWHKKRVERLKADDGWLNLIGRFWLKKGDNSFGSSDKNDIVVSGKNIPDVMGIFLLKDGIVTLISNKDVNIKLGDSSVTEIVMRDDLSGDIQYFSYNNIRWNLINRDGKMGIRFRDLNNEAAKNFKGIERYPVDKEYKITAKFKPYPQPKIITIPTVLGTTTQDTSYGKIFFNLFDKEYTLEPIGKDRLFIIFADETNSDETYGAGRFLYSDAPDSLGNVIIDFNKSYNPPCALTKYATCPLPHKENFLSVKIEAGEKKYGEH